jgi:hypothetical protein
MTDNAQAGGSVSGCNVPVNNQNVIIDANPQNAAAQMAQQILANANVTLKQELVKIPDFWGEKAKDTVTATQFMARIDECQFANDWNNTTMYANFSLYLHAEAIEWLAYTVRLHELSAAERTWTHICPLFKREFELYLMTSLSWTDSPISLTDQEKIHANSWPDWRNFLTRSMKTTLRIVSSRTIREQIQPQGTYTEDNLTSFANNSVKAYNKFLFTQVFWAATPESVRKLLSHKDQTHLMVDDVYQMFFTDHRVETDRKERAMVNAVNEEEDTNSQDPDVAVFRPKPRQQQQQQRYPQQQNSGYKGNQNQQRGKRNNKNSYPKKSNPSNSEGNYGNGKFCCYCKILNHSQEECRKE